MSAQFKDEHDRLRAMLHDYIALMTGDKPDVQAVMRARRSFAGLFHSHHLGEGEVLQRLRASPCDAETVQRLNVYAERKRDFFLRYSELVQQWPLQRLMDEWPTYCSAIRSHKHVFLDFLQWEETMIHPLLARGPQAFTPGDARAGAHVEQTPN